MFPGILGPVAQSGERDDGIVEAAGAEPAGSTNFAAGVAVANAVGLEPNDSPRDCVPVPTENFIADPPARSGAFEAPRHGSTPWSAAILGLGGEPVALQRAIRPVRPSRLSSTVERSAVDRETAVRHCQAVPVVTRLEALLACRHV